MQLDPEIEQRLDHLVANTGKAKSDFLREFIQNGLDDLEDVYLANATLERVRNGSEKVLSSSQVRKALGLDR
ncbi:CopG family transcriptional regulator [Polynucleobacter sp.]|uniref:type II toxin-antitoxin system RelB family antitoxin n=1 Tax=Polynucleobacter sp. TaxID=2029855 RepID=UPI002732FA49|nr:CopG family transcriptional regulator [Polynucleobacter sp.]MDP3122751.1 CopG family transcriptional regulator [Polynucleobacter sp.]